MAKKEQPINNNNNVNIVNVRVPSQRKSYSKKASKPNWILKAIVLAVIGLIVSIILIWIQRSTAANGKPAYIQSQPTSENRN